MKYVSISRSKLALPVFFRALLIALALASNARSEDLSRTEAERLWRENNRDLKIAASAVSGAKGDLAAADRAPNPNVSLSTSQISTHTGIGAGAPGDKAIDSVLRVEQSWERGGKRDLRARAGQARVMAAEADAIDATRQGLIQLYNAYWDLKLAIERERLTRSAAELARTSAGASEKRLAAGDIAAADLAKLQVDTLHAENDARSAVADREKAQYSLAILIGREHDAPAMGCADDWPPLESTAVLVAGTGDVNIRADVKAAGQRMEAATAARDGAKALAVRDITIGLQYERYPPAAGLSPNNTWGISVAVPLFASRSYFSGEIQRAEADLEAARELAKRTRSLARQEVARALSDLRASAERRQRLEQALLPAAERVARANEFAYANGAISLLDLLDARRTLRQTQQEGAAARNDYARALATWQLQFPREPQRLASLKEFIDEK